ILRGAEILNRQSRYQQAAELFLLDVDSGEYGIDPYLKMHGLLQAANGCLNEGQPGLALRLYRQVLPQKLLQEKQQSQAEKLRKRLDVVLKKSSVQNEHPLWSEYLLELFQRVSLHHEVLQGDEDYTPSFLLGYGRA